MAPRGGCGDACVGGWCVGPEIWWCSGGGQSRCGTTCGSETGEMETITTSVTCQHVTCQPLWCVNLCDVSTSVTCQPLGDNPPPQTNVIYCIECKTYLTQYAGQRKREIKERIREHLLTIKKNSRSNDAPTHFNLCDHHGTEDVQGHVYILDFTYRHPDSLMAGRLRNTIGFNWILRLWTQSPQGLNTMDNRYG